MSIKKIIISISLFSIVVVGIVFISKNYQKPKNMDTSIKILSAKNLTKILEKNKKFVIIINYWASWCDSCKSNLKTLGSFQKKYKNQGLRVIGVSLDNPEDKFKFSLVKFLYTDTGDYFIKAIAKKGQTKKIMTILEKKWAAIVPIYYLVTQGGKRVQRFVGSSSIGKVRKELRQVFD